MWRVVWVRAVSIIPAMLVASLAVFVLVQLVPGGAAEAIAGPEASPEQIAQIRARLGTDRPFVSQYVGWLTGVLSGDLGSSFLNGGSIAPQIGRALPMTLELALLALLFSIVVGGGLGVWAAVSADRPVDRWIRRGFSIAVGVPEFWIAMLAVAFFSVRLGWVPSSGIAPAEEGLFAHVKSVALPVVMLALGPTALLGRMVRSEVVDSLGSLYVRSHRAAGLSTVVIYGKYVLRNSISASLNMVGLLFGALLGGAVLIEKVFSIRGIGSLLIDSALGKDVPMIQAVTLTLVFIVLLTSLFVDTLHSIVDPRVRRAH